MSNVAEKIRKRMEGMNRADSRSQDFCSADSYVGQQGPKISCTKTQTLPNLILLKSSDRQLQQRQQRH